MTREDRFGRRRFIGAIAASSAVGVAGCSLPLGTNTDDDGGRTIDVPPLTEFRGSGAIVEGRPAPGGTSIADLPDLSGSLKLYIGGGEGGIYSRFIDMLQEIYPNFTVFENPARSSSHAQTIVQEVESNASPADVFWSIDASSLAYVAQNDASEPLPADVIDPVPEGFRGSNGEWVGVAGRARSVPYNTEQLNADDVPQTVRQFPDSSALQGTMGWAPTYGAFKSFVTAMRLLRGPDPTRQWLVSMREQGTERYPNEYVVSQQVADGTLAAGFANHYYAMRVKNQRPDAPIDLAFTRGDAGALVNVAGVLRVKGSEKDQLVNDFVKHLLSAEAQEFFTTVSFAYPMIEGVQPVGDLPTVDELNPPDIDLSQLDELGPTLTLMREAGVLG